MTDTTRDAFLGGRLTLTQPRHGYRAGVDPVFLAAACPAKPGQRVLDVGCGVGTAGLCLGARVEGLILSGVELQPSYADLARQNATDNGQAMQIWNCDVTDPPRDLRQQQFDHIITNPPYFKTGTPAQDQGRAAGRGEGVDLDLWLDFVTRRLAPKGQLTLIQIIARLPDVLSCLQGRMGAIVVQPLAARMARAPGLFLLHARKSGRTDFRLNPTMALHQGDHHVADGDSYTPLVSSVLRAGQPFSFFD